MGLESSCPISRLVMDDWADELIHKAEISKELHHINPIQFEALNVYLLEKYVITAQDTMKPGTR